MSLLKTISGIRGTIGGAAGDNLTPQDIVECSAAFGYWVIKKTNNPKIVVGRDARISGDIVNGLVVNTLRAVGIDVVDVGLSTTPTVEMAVPMENAGAGIILTASHNPKEWNALKLLNDKGEFISAADATEFLGFIKEGNIEYATVDKLGSYREDDTYIDKHIEAILALRLVKVDEVVKRKFKVVVDCVNSTGTITVPNLLEKLGCEVIVINGDVTGNFAHKPEPVPENLRQLSSAVLSNNADLGIAVDPDVDRLALVNEDGTMFGEEYTLVAVSDYILKNTPDGESKNTVSNLSSTRALKDVTVKNGGMYHAAAVGEVNVVTKMKEVNAVIGGEGNGGVIYPELHYGRDALAGIALILSQLVEFGNPLSWLKRSFPQYVISKNKIELTDQIDLDFIFKKLKEKYSNEDLNTIDGLKINFESDWIHLRKSNTEPIIRIYSESASLVTADNLAKKMQQDISDILKQVAI